MAIDRSLGVLRPIHTLFRLGAVGRLTDAELLARFIDQSDEMAAAAFDALVRRHGPMVLRVALDVLGNRDDAQDAFQATFLVLARRASGIGRPETLGQWLYGVARRAERMCDVDVVLVWLAEAGSGVLAVGHKLCVEVKNPIGALAGRQSVGHSLRGTESGCGSSIVASIRGRTG
jgi:hypothetical protein